MTDRPEISVALATRDRPVRLRWLLNALAEQTLARERFEVVVANGSTRPETTRLLAAHPLARDGVLRHLDVPPAPGPARNRNHCWRAARAPLVLFTDDDCRPPADWLERALDAALRHPGAIVQGRTTPDPDEGEIVHACPHARTQRVDPPTPFAETCNIAYPREVLERHGGFHEDEPLQACEDTDLALRARESGTDYVGAPEMLTYHAVDAVSLLHRVRASGRWGELPWLVKRHPRLRRETYYLRIFWTPIHLCTALAVAGLTLSLRRRAALTLVLPWLVADWPKYGAGVRGLLRSLTELPGHAAIDLAELAVLARGSLRYRSLLL
ncbi:MAG: glycosyltransferase [Thermoleophilaceae bacterium]